nr:hypothetical protein [Tanacetum cinerariifolium]
MNQNFYNSNSSGFDKFQPPQYSDVHQPPEEISIDELKIMMQSYCEMMSQRCKQAAQKEQELLAQKQAAQEKEEPPQNSNFRQLIGEMCSIKASAEKKQKLEEMMLELLELCRKKEFYCVHDSIEDLIGMAMNTMLLSINLKSQLFDKEKQDVKNIIEQKNLMWKLPIRFLSLSLYLLSPLFLATDDLMPPGIENDDYDSEGDIHFLEELLSNDPLSLPENESSNFDYHDDPSFPRPPPKPPDVEVFFDFEPNTGVLTIKVVKGISEHCVLMPNILPTLPTLDPDLDFTPSYDSFGSENKNFNPGIFIEV